MDPETRFPDTPTWLKRIDCTPTTRARTPSSPARFQTRTEPTGQAEYETSKLYIEHDFVLHTRITLCLASSSRLNHIDSPHLAHFAISTPHDCSTAS